MLNKLFNKKLYNLSKRSYRAFVVLLVLLSSSLFFGCSSKDEDNRIVIWTNCSEFAQYIELFNKTHKDNSAVLVYKENPAASLPLAKDEQAPDIIVGPWLRSDDTQKIFKPLDYLFDNQILTSQSFYSALLESGKISYTQYLLPVSFNLPAIIFSTENKDLVSDSYTLSLEQIKDIAAEFNEKNKKGAYTKMGFTPLSSGNGDFLYLASKLMGVQFRSENGKITWNDGKLDETAKFLKDWVVTNNGSAETEEDFTFKYLFMPNYRQVTSGRTLFSYTTSDELLKIMKDQNLDLDYRWIAEDKKIPMEDSFIMMGIYKDCNNQVGATEFINWFFDVDNQRAILERKEKFNLETEIFGISGGFSSLRDVTEHILPIFYTQLLTNIPPSQMISVPEKLPPLWDSYQEYVVDKYFTNYIWADEGEEIQSIPQLEKEWQKKVFD